MKAPAAWRLGKKACRWWASLTSQEQWWVMEAAQGKELGSACTTREWGRVLARMPMRTMFRLDSIKRRALMRRG